MSTPHTPTLALPTDAVANRSFPYDARIAGARRFLASRGIHEVRPLYGMRAKPVSLNARLAAPLARPAHARGAANDDATSALTRRDSTAA